MDFRQLKEIHHVKEFDFLSLSPVEEPEPPEVDVDSMVQETSSKIKRSKGRPELILPPEGSSDRDLDNFILQAMNQSMDPDTNTVRDLRIDDRDLPLSTNYYHFCSEVAGKAIKPPFARQLFVAYNLLGEYCPKCTSNKWLDINNIPVDMDVRDLARKVTLLERGVCPKCSATKSSLILNDELVDYNQLVLILGQRAGKSSFTATLAANIVHRLLKAPKLSDICAGIQEFTPLTMTVVGLTSSRAIRLLWNPITEIIKSSSWFEQYFSLLDHYGKKYDKELYKSMTLFYRFFTKNLDLYPSGPLKRTLRGDTRFFSACLSGSTRVLTTSGWRRIDDPTIIDSKVIVNGKTHSILRWIPQGRKTTYRVTLENGLTVDCTSDHKFLLEDGSKLAVKDFNLGETEVVCDLNGASKIKSNLPVDTSTDEVFEGTTRPKREGKAIQSCSPLKRSVWNNKEGLKKISKNRYLSKVISIEKLGVEDVYDLSIDSEEHVFVANGITVSNCDEICWFPFKLAGNSDSEEEEDEREHANADEVHQSLENSLTTVRTEVYSLYKKGINIIPTGINVNISSPSSKKDKGMRLLKESVNPEALSLGLQLATWQINPLYTRDHPIIKSAYAKNPVRADRDFGAKPPDITSSIFNADRILPLFRGEPNPFVLSRDRNADFTVATLVNQLGSSRNWNPQVLTIDAGVINNSFAITIGERDGVDMIVNFVAEIIPVNGFPISFSQMYRRVILPLVQACNVVYLAADRWNSLSTLHQIRDDTNNRCLSASVTLGPRDFDSFITSVSSGNMTFPRLEEDFNLEKVLETENYKDELVGKPISHLFLQFMTVQETNKVFTKAEGYTDDLLRSVVVLHRVLFEERVKKHLSEHKGSTAPKASSRATIFSASRSGIRW